MECWRYVLFHIFVKYKLLQKCVVLISGSLPIPECAQLLDNEELAILKAQCGGLQTLLRNHHQIFNGMPRRQFFSIRQSICFVLVAKGNVSIRDWMTDSKRYQKNNKRSCWFYTNHPDGCPLDANLCPYAHVE